MPHTHALHTSHTHTPTRVGRDPCSRLRWGRDRVSEPICCVARHEVADAVRQRSGILLQRRLNVGAARSAVAHRLRRKARDGRKRGRAACRRRQRDVAALVAAGHVPVGKAGRLLGAAAVAPLGRFSHVDARADDSARVAHPLCVHQQLRKRCAARAACICSRLPDARLAQTANGGVVQASALAARPVERGHGGAVGWDSALLLLGGAWNVGEGMGNAWAGAWSCAWGGAWAVDGLRMGRCMRRCMGHEAVHGA
eukprot:363477-Chlamydomonas_euryale.AAC.6